MDKDMGLECPTIDEGEIYCIREVDFLTQKQGPYVKLGKTTRKTAQRLKEHQTGNPRQETAEFVLHTDMMSSLEKFLHYRFAPNCVNSEWFIMDTPTVMSDVAPLIQKLAAEHKKVRPTFDEWKKQASTVSNGNTIPVNSTHNKLQTQYLKLWERYKKAEGVFEISKLDVQRFIGTNNGIENMVYLVTSEKIPFDKDAFLASLASDAERNKCFKEEKKVLPKAPKIDGELSLSKIDSGLNDSKNLKKNAYNSAKPSPANLSNPITPVTTAMKTAHQAYLKSKREFKEAEWELQKITAELVSHLGDNESIDGIITWKREEKVSQKFDRDTAKKQFPTQYSKFEGTPETIIWRVNIDDGKKY